jgi:hypothetical protein
MNQDCPSECLSKCRTAISAKIWSHTCHHKSANSRAIMNKQCPHKANVHCICKQAWKCGLKVKCEGSNKVRFRVDMKSRHNHPRPAKPLCRYSFQKPVKFLGLSSHNAPIVLQLKSATKKSKRNIIRIEAKGAIGVWTQLRGRGLLKASASKLGSLSITKWIKRVHTKSWNLPGSVPCLKSSDKTIKMTAYRMLLSRKKMVYS